LNKLIHQYYKREFR